MTGAQPPADGLPFAAAADLLRSAAHTLVVCHTDPDGDALGSVSALVRGLRSVGLAADGLVPGRQVPRRYAFLATPQEVLAPEALVGASRPGLPDVLVTVDASTPERLAEHQGLLERARVVVVIDHHAGGRDYGDLRLVDPAAAATTVLVERLLQELGVPMDPALATALYTGLMTDTGSFRHERTTAESHRMAARMIEAGASPTAVAEAVFEGVPYGTLRLSGRILGRAVLEPVTPELGLIWSSVSAEELAEYQVEAADLEGLVSVMRSAAEAEVAVFLREEDDGTWKTSLRSGEAVDVAELASRLGGGGHPRAAGFTSTESLVKTVGTVRRAVRTAVSGPRA